MKEAIYCRYLRTLDGLLKSHKIIQFKALFTMVLFSSLFSKKYLLWKKFHAERNIFTETISVVQCCFSLFNSSEKNILCLGNCPHFYRLANKLFCIKNVIAYSEVALKICLTGIIKRKNKDAKIILFSYC